MLRENANDLLAFLVVARERSFTKAAAKIGVSPTEAGERLMQTIGPHVEAIEFQLTALSDLRDRPAGNLRINATDYALDCLLRPKLKAFMLQYPDINVEVCCDYGLVDIAAHGFDAGVRLGESLADGMIATRIGPDMRMAVVGSPDYFARFPSPDSPRDLTAHRCNNLRLATHGNLYAWEFERDGESLNVKVTGQAIHNGVYPLLGAAVDGLG